jgi:hypothetical protein
MASKVPPQKATTPLLAQGQPNRKKILNNQQVLTESQKN